MTRAAAQRASHSIPRNASARAAELFEQHGRMVYGICRAMLRDVHEAEDATQQAFLSAYRALLGGAHVRDPAGWLATIARNECRGRIGAGMRRPLPLADEDLDALESTIDHAARRTQVDELRTALAALPERQREAAVLRYVYGFRYGEVAKALGLSRPATDALLFRARRALHGRLRPVAGAVLAVPVAVRDELAQAIPGFAAGGGGSSAASAAAAGGVLAKLVAAPAGAKLATAVFAVSTVAAVGAIESDRPARTETAGAVGVPTIAAERAQRVESGARAERGRADDRGPGELLVRESAQADREAPDDTRGDRTGGSAEEAGRADAGRSSSTEHGNEGAGAAADLARPEKDGDGSGSSASTAATDSEPSPSSSSGSSDGSASAPSSLEETSGSENSSAAPEGSEATAPSGSSDPSGEVDGSDGES